VRRVFALPAVLIALAASFVACGGDDEPEPTRTRSETDTRPAKTVETSPAEGRAGEADRDDRAGGRRREGIPNARVTATGAVQTLPPSEEAQRTAHENSYSSIKAFGAETSGEEATAITFALVEYLTAKAEGDWATACARLYSVLREDLERSAGGRGCPDAYGEMMSRVPRATLAEQAKIDVSSVRRGEDDRAFVVYKTPDTLSADMPMYVEDGVWKVGAIEAYVLTPDRAG
jgi:hypothetical protein